MLAGSPLVRWKYFGKISRIVERVAPDGTPFFCNRNAMMLVEFFAETEPGAIIGISV